MRKFFLGFLAVMGVLFLEDFLSMTLKDLSKGVLGNAFLKALSYSPVLIYAFLIKKYKFKFGGSSDKVSKQFLLNSIGLLFLLFLCCRLLLEFELLFVNGWDKYVKELNQVFAWSTSLIKHALTYLLVGPLVEEVFFRGVLLKKLCVFSKKYSLYFTSFLFALSHVRLGLIFSSFSYSFVLGFFLGRVMLKTNHLGYVIILHILWNLLNYLIPFLLSCIINI
jgi:membrane protease YdiL (CAAX protease family)